MSENPELVFVTEKGMQVKVDAEAVTTLVQELLCQGKLKFVEVRDTKNE